MRSNRRALTKAEYRDLGSVVVSGGHAPEFEASPTSSYFAAIQTSRASRASV